MTSHDIPTRHNEMKLLHVKPCVLISCRGKQSLHSRLTSCCQLLAARRPRETSAHVPSRRRTLLTAILRRDLMTSSAACACWSDCCQRWWCCCPDDLVQKPWQNLAKVFSAESRYCHFAVVFEQVKRRCYHF